MLDTWSLCLSTEIQLDSVNEQTGGAQGLYVFRTVALLASLLALQVVRTGARLQGDEFGGVR